MCSKDSKESTEKLTLVQVVLLALKGLAALGDNAFISVVTEICVLSKVRLYNILSFESTKLNFYRPKMRMFAKEQLLQKVQSWHMT